MKFIKGTKTANGEYVYLKNVSDNDAALLRYIGFEIWETEEIEIWFRPVPGKISGQLYLVQWHEFGISHIGIVTDDIKKAEKEFEKYKQYLVTEYDLPSESNGEYEITDDDSTFYRIIKNNTIAYIELNAINII